MDRAIDLYWSVASSNPMSKTLNHLLIMVCPRNGSESDLHKYFLFIN